MRPAACVVRRLLTRLLTRLRRLAPSALAYALTHPYPLVPHPATARVPSRPPPSS